MDSTADATAGMDTAGQEVPQTAPEGPLTALRGLS